MSHTFDRHFWEERYHGHGGAHTRQPHTHLMDAARNLTPGTALDAGCGEGADTLWLASHGWRVKAVDIASSALERARAHARDLGTEVADRVEWERADLAAWEPPAARFDLVCSHYVHTHGSDQALFQRLAEAVAPGGTLLIVGHQPTREENADPHGPIPGSHVRAEETAAHLDPDRWEVIVAEPRTRTVAASDGREVVLHDSVLWARRHR
ncbi:class I SAM-dependent methyltransferase [Nocardiopsis halotolerans]|uniref:class I SAM-dependent methyltransferase n=1 Tax=Nocardiopsis halotolerans TaxID=124252 RepID=UPI00034ACBA0|nr:class I SAM-dependent methyltransferase [Nocardiopsis halotolerans]